MTTARQHELLTFIDGYLREHGFSPAFDEMKDSLGLKSKSGVDRLLTGLAKGGFITRRPGRARAIEVIRMPGSTEWDRGHAVGYAAGYAAGLDAGAGTVAGAPALVRFTHSAAGGSQ